MKAIAVLGVFLASTLAHAEVDPDLEQNRGDMYGRDGGGLFKSMDANGDGVVSNDEFDDFSARHFKKLDANNDGKITPHEMYGEQKQGSTHHGMTPQNDRFSAADANQDGGIDREEAKVMPMLPRYFDEIDADKDGKITRQEYNDAMPRLHRGKQLGPVLNQQTL